MDPYFEDEKDWVLTKFKDNKIEVVVRPGSGGQKFRFGFPGKYGGELRLETGDILVLNIDSIKRRKSK